jgi:hypothetical protein
MSSKLEYLLGSFSDEAKPEQGTKIYLRNRLLRKYG